MHFRRLIALLGAGFTALVVSGCVDVTAACISTGICDVPPDPTITIDVICDSSLGSTCTKSAITATLDNTLPLIAQRPGSTVRLWAMSGTVDGVVTLGIVTSPETSPATRTKRREQDAFVDAAKARLLLNADAAFLRPAAQSPIADTLARVLMATSGDERRLVIVISDMREFQSGRYDFECGPLPSPEAFTKKLIADRVLAPDSMKHLGVAFTYVGVPPVDKRRCPATIQRAKAIEALWTTVVTSTGGTVVRYTDGAVQLADLGR